MIFRKAKQEDTQQIAELHATSWQQNYRGSFSDDFLDHGVLPNRIEVWKTRLSDPPKNQYVIVAEEDGALLGFVCAYLDEDAEYGTYLDNLHVSLKAQGKGIGSKLMGRLAKELNGQSEKGIYLWVLENNHVAIRFYERLKGKALDKVEADDIGDAPFIKIRYVWNSLSELQAIVEAKSKNP